MNSQDLVAPFRKELQLCNVAPGETVAIYTEGGARRLYADAFSMAARELGATVFHVDLPVARERQLHHELGGRSEGGGLAGSPIVVDAFKQSDLLIDLVFMLWESKEKHEIQEQGTRILTCLEPPDVLLRLFPTAEQRRKAKEQERMLRTAKTLRLTNEAGTDVTYELDNDSPFCQYGIADAPGRWDHFASTFACAIANDGGVNGTVVIAPGDIILPLAWYVNTPTKLEIKEGAIRSIKGGGDAFLMRDYIEKYDDPRGFAISHIGWGLNESASWTVLTTPTDSIGMDARSFLGSVQFATGPNTEFGGSNDTPCHMDIPMRKCSVYLDDELVLDRERVVKQAVRSAAAS